MYTRKTLAEARHHVIGLPGAAARAIMILCRALRSVTFATNNFASLRCVAILI